MRISLHWRRRAAMLAKLFGDRLYIELQRHGIESERRCDLR
jgi:DNA polymerase-3 subunit alpha